MGIDREKLRARKKRHYERHREQCRARNKRYYWENRDRLLEQNRQWREAHPNVGPEGVKRWRVKKPDLHQAAARACACNQRAKAAGAEGHISRADITALWDRQPACMVCGNGRGVDHIMPFWQGGQNVVGNLQNLCKECNMRKQAKLDEAGVQAMRSAYAAGTTDRKILAAQFGVSAGNVWLIVTDRTWRHLLGED